MEIRFSRELDGSYLIISELQEGDFFTGQMLMRAHPPRLLQMKTGRRNDCPEYCYEISGLKSLETMLSAREISADEILDIMRSIYRVSHELEEYLLNPDRLWLEPGLMFRGKDGWQFCLHPSRNTDFYEQLQGLSRYILKKTDPNDERTSRMAYELFRVVHEDNVSFSQIWEALETEELTEEEESQTEKVEKKGFRNLFRRRRNMSLSETD